VRQYVAYGAGPRAGVFLVHAARALAALQGSASVSTSHIRDLALPLLRHRILLNYRGNSESIRVKEIIDEIVRMLDRE